MSNFGIVSKKPHKFWYSIKKYLLKMPLKDSYFFQLRICIKLDILQLFNQNNISQQTDYRAAVRIQLSFIKSDVRDLQKCKMVPLFSLNFCFVL